MKKNKMIIGIAVVAIAAVATVNLQLSSSSDCLSKLTTANIDALAGETSGMQPNYISEEKKILSGETGWGFSTGFGINTSGEVEFTFGLNFPQNNYQFITCCVRINNPMSGCNLSLQSPQCNQFVQV